MGIAIHQTNSHFSVIGATTAQIVFANRAANTSDPSFALWPAVLCTQIVQACSIATACVLYLRPLLESLESGLIRSDDLRRRGLEGTDGYGTSKGTRKGSSLRPCDSAHGDTIPLPSALRPLRNVGNTTTTLAEDLPWEDGQSATSRTRIVKNTSQGAAPCDSRCPELGVEGS